MKQNVNSQLPAQLSLPLFLADLRYRVKDVQTQGFCDTSCLAITNLWIPSLWQFMKNRRTVQALKIHASSQEFSSIYHRINANSPNSWSVCYQPLPRNLSPRYAIMAWLSFRIKPSSSIRGTEGITPVWMISGCLQCEKIAVHFVGEISNDSKLLWKPQIKSY